MTSVGTIGARRLRFVGMTISLLAVVGVSVSGIANATPPKFDVQGYSTCTATTTPAPDQDFDGMVAACCVQNAGVPTPSTYGMACVAAAPENAQLDYRPTIVLPSRPQPVDDGGLLGGPSDLGETDFPGNPDIAGSPFDEGGPQ